MSERQLVRMNIVGEAMTLGTVVEEQLEKVEEDGVDPKMVVDGPTLTKEHKYVRIAVIQPHEGANLESADVEKQLQEDNGSKCRALPYRERRSGQKHSGGQIHPVGSAGGRNRLDRHAELRGKSKL
ncbi:hypothetical protein GNI_054560 [Gregarina niphandrodes]|uniref:Uncharacterized protein n=1 Tax=Gregarina niphandrodes TaxID=110365 RepID=A0A023B939_GRENI|nr:hypothetical protein GNI_054560 [Gregarina niphandrodes]EZG70703.1 hypothetical protein GNI_054560 [Gregarina niphandrodes]|eukprot:XP_011129886.1 hypothetical protein GNI_054560 [Gregarina niphandrodes]